MKEQHKTALLCRSYVHLCSFLINKYFLNKLKIHLFFYNLAGKGVSIWDTYVHKHTSFIADGSNGDVAADSYHQYMQDVAALKKLRVSTNSVCSSDFIVSVNLTTLPCLHVKTRESSHINFCNLKQILWKMIQT
jgi:hypothetical protein